MTGKSLCEMRGYVSTSTQLLRNDFSQLCIFWERRSDMRLLKKKFKLIVAHSGRSIRLIVWDAATCGGTLNYKRDEPTSLFLSLSISFSSRRACLDLW